MKRDLSKPLAESFFGEDKPKRKVVRTKSKSPDGTKTKTKKVFKKDGTGTYKSKTKNPDGSKSKVKTTGKSNSKGVMTWSKDDAKKKEKLSPKDRKLKRKVEKWMKKNM